MPDIFHNFNPFGFFYGIVAVCGGIARYLTGYVDGQNFSFRIFLASVFVSGFSGWMFAFMGQSLQMPQEIIYIMAGAGGFMGDQTMKFIISFIKTKI